MLLILWLLGPQIFPQNQSSKLTNGEELKIHTIKNTLSKFSNPVIQVLLIKNYCSHIIISLFVIVFYTPNKCTYEEL